MAAVLLLALAAALAPRGLAQGQYDVVIYGGTAGGVSAAVQAARMGKTVALIEPTARIGGMTTNGLSFTDTGNSGAIQGLAREFYLDIGQHYGQSTPEFNFEPKAGLGVFNDWIQTTPGISLFTNQRLDLTNGVTKQGNRISSIRTEGGLTFSGSMFIDAGYEGDLMARAGVGYAIGRESNATYGEQYNGVQRGASGHNFSTSTPVDPYVVPGNPASGLLPGINPTPPPANGTGDNRVQSYNYRLTLTQAANRRAWTAPANYNAADYELLKRYIPANSITSVKGKLLKIDSIRGGKFDLNNQGPVSTDFIGQNYAYPDATYATRDQIVQEHRDYQQGLLYFLATDPSLPASIRTEMNSYGLTTDEFTDNAGWSDQLYVREARRMLGRYVMTDNNIVGANPVKVNDSIGLGSYTMDSHHTQRFVDETGHVRNEGDVQAGVSQPYRISYRSITPFENQASNLLVTTALSASHIAFGSIRMEPVFMELGQAGGAAAALAIDSNTSVQGLNYQSLRQTLIGAGALLEWPANLTLVPFTVTADFNDFTTFPTAFGNTAGGTGMTGLWAGTGTQNVVAGSLTYTLGGYAIQQSGAGSAGKVQGTYNEPRQNRRTLSNAMIGDIWFSMLVQNPDAQARAGLSINPATNGDPAAGAIERLLVLSGNSLTFQVNGTTLGTAAGALAVGQTHLLLGKLSVDVAGGNDQLLIWADPADLSLLGTPDITISGVDLLDSLSGVGLLSYNTNGPAFSANGGFIDALRISNQSDGFFQVTGVPEPSALAAVGALTLLARRRRRK
jgi:hypothetical protein